MDRRRLVLFFRRVLPVGLKGGGSSVVQQVNLKFGEASNVSPTVSGAIQVRYAIRAYKKRMVNSPASGFNLEKNGPTTFR